MILNTYSIEYNLISCGNMMDLFCTAHLSFCIRERALQNPVMHSSPDLHFLPDSKILNQIWSIIWITSVFKNYAIVRASNQVCRTNDSLQSLKSHRNIFKTQQQFCIDIAQRPIFHSHGANTFLYVHYNKYFKNCVPNNIQSNVKHGEKSILIRAWQGIYDMPIDYITMR